MKSEVHSAVQVLQRHLQKGEDIRWAGQPELSLFTTVDIFLIPFSILWGGFAIFWEASVIILPATSGDGVPLEIRILFPLFGMFFVLAGLYMIFGRFVYKRWKKKNTYYAITDRRLIELTRGPTLRLNSAPIDAVSNANVAQGRNGLGTVTFSTAASASLWRFPFSQGYGVFSNTGLDVFGGQQGIAFFDIKDAEIVYQLVEELRHRRTTR